MLSENLKTIRKNKGFTQEELASRLNVTRQTISKWEKGYSVPDAAMLVDIAEVFDIPVSELLGSEKVETIEKDVLVEQLSHLNEQLAIRNRRSKKIWKIVGVVLLAIVIFCAAVSVLGMINYANMEKTKMAGSTTWECTLDGKTYTCTVEYNDKYDVIGQTGDTYIYENLDIITDVSDANDVDEYLRSWFVEKGGSVKISEQVGLALKE